VIIDFPLPHPVQPAPVRHQAISGVDDENKT
jgi:hypothetical protein